MVSEVEEAVLEVVVILEVIKVVVAEEHTTVVEAILVAPTVVMPLQLLNLLLQTHSLTLQQATAKDQPSSLFEM